MNRFWIASFLGCLWAGAVGDQTAAQPVVDPLVRGVMPLAEGWDYAGPMKKVAAKFRGHEGVVLHVGASMTIANPYGTWARSGKGQTPEDKAVLKWMHTEKKDKTDGWWLCRTEVVPYRAHTSESGLTAHMLFAGGKRGLPTLEKLLDTYKPRMVTLEVGIYDVEEKVSLEDYRQQMAKALDLILDRGAIPVLNTIPPFKAQLERTKQFNDALHSLAKERGAPVLDLEREILTRRPDDWFGTLMKRIHLTAGEAGGSPGAEPTAENLRRSGYLLRGCLTVRKIAEIKRSVLDDAGKSAPAPPKGDALLRNLEPNRWVCIHQPTAGEPTFRRQPHGGSCFDARRGRLVLFGSDSHGRDFTNSPLFFDTATLKWSRAYADDARETYQVTAEGLAVAGGKGNHPWAMHTFGSVVYDSARDEMIVPIFDDHLVPGRFTSVFQDLWPRIKRKPTWIYRMGTSEWTTLPGDGVSCFPHCAVYDSDRRVVVAVKPDGIHELTGEPRQWKRITKQGFFGWHTNGAYDSKHKAVVVFGSNENRNDVAVYSPGTGVYKLMPTPGVRPPKDQHNPMEFHPDLGKTVVLVDRIEGDRKQTETWLYDLGADVWTQSPTATLPFACGMNYNLEFDPRHRLLLLVTGGDGTPTRVWALRLAPV